MNEEGYLNVLQKILDNGIERKDRTGVGTLSLFGEQMKFNLDGQFPLLTTKRTFWKGVAKELIWFIKGDTNAKNLQKDGIHIWDGNSSREFLDSRGLTHLEEGDLGPVYGFNWRYWNAKYTDCNTDYSNQGIDQLKNIINEIKDNPDSRRLLLTSWNPSTLNDVALPACHSFCQFYVINGYLSCHMYQRSADMFLGSPFNIASYALLTYMIAHITHLKPKELIISMGDTHIYKNHIDQVKTQLERKPYNFPTLHFKRNISNIDDFVFEDLELQNYNCHSAIKAVMAI